MTPWRFKQWFPANRMHCRRELIVALDFIAACIIAQLFLDHWLAALVREFQSSPVVHALSLVPDRVQLSLLFTVGMVLLLSYRVTSGDRLRTDRGMFPLGCGVVAGFVVESRSYSGRSCGRSFGHLAGASSPISWLGRNHCCEQIHNWSTLS